MENDATAEEIEQARRALGGQLARLRKAAGLSQHDLAPLTHYGRSTIANVEVGRQNVPRSFWLRCDEVLSTGGTLVDGFDALEAAQRRNAEQQAVVAGRTSAGAQGSVDLVAVAELREQLRGLVTAYDTTPSVALLAPAARWQSRIAALQSAVLSGVVRRELLSVEAEAAVFMGQLIWDASGRRDHGSALAHLQQAVALAQQIGDPVTEAQAVLRRSYVALYGQADPQRGLALATRAAQLSRQRSPALAGLALLHVAEAWGMLLQRQACERALGQADEQFAVGSDIDVAADCYSPTQSGRLAGSCYLSLGLHARAEDELGGVARQMAAEYKVSALVLGNLGLAQLGQGQLDAALGSLHLAIDALERTRGGGGITVVFRAGRELQAWRTENGVREVHDRMLGLLSPA